MCLHAYLSGWPAGCSQQKKRKRGQLPKTFGNKGAFKIMSTTVSDHEATATKASRNCINWKNNTARGRHGALSRAAEVLRTRRRTLLYDREGIPYLDLQMWYSAASFGYGNKRLNDALKRQIDKLPQLACQYLHTEKVELAAALGRLNESKFGLNGRVHFNVGGAQAIEDSLKVVRNATGKNLVFAFMGVTTDARLERRQSARVIATGAALAIFQTALTSCRFPIAFAVLTGRSARTAVFIVLTSSPETSTRNTTHSGSESR